jgi:signal transduction histidine kinase
MSLWNSKSIAGKLTRVNLLVSGSALVLAYVAFLACDLYMLRRDLINSLTTEAGIVGASSVMPLILDNRQAAETMLLALKQSPSIFWAVITRTDGSLFAQYQRDPSSPPDLSRTLELGQSRQSWSTDDRILLGSRIDFDGRHLGAIYLQAGTGELERRAGEFGLLSALILSICFAITMMATAATRDLVWSPLTKLAQTARIVNKEKDYSLRAPMPDSGDELALLVSTFNEMLDQIQERDRALGSSPSELENRVRERTAGLTQVNKELEAFAYSVAHDLRGPLQQIVNLAFLLERSKAHVPENELLIHRLVDSTQSMAALIDDLLNLSRATSTPLNRTEVDLSRMAETILEEFKAEDRNRNVRIQVRMGGLAVADAGLIRVALANLLHNAWKYTSRVKEAEIEFGFVEQPDAGVVYFVRDNGAGFNPRNADRLFRPFQRLHSQSEFPGTGIGLATAQRIIGRHGGKIWAESNVGKGAVFYFTLPSAAAK